MNKELTNIMRHDRLKSLRGLTFAGLMLLGMMRTVPAQVPTITGQPTNTYASLGSNPIFAVGATGVAPLRYQWLFNDVPIARATNSALTVTNAQLAGAGNYSVIVTNINGNATSAVATLTVGLAAAWGLNFHKEDNIPLNVTNAI